MQKHGVEIDICPDCTGIWLDRGELEKIIKIAANGGPAESMEPDYQEKRPERREDNRERHHDQDHDRGQEYSDPKNGKHKRRGSWLSDILGSFGEGGGD